MIDNQAMLKPYLYTLLIFALAIPLSSAHASKTVTSATVTAGETSVESKSEYIIDHNPNKAGAWKEKVNIAHGFTSFWSSEIETNIERGGARHNDAQVTNVEWKNKFQFTRQGESWLDTGARLSYSYNTSGGSDRIELKLLAGRKCGRFISRGNLILDREVGQGAENATNWGLSWSGRYAWHDGIQPGAELYSTFGEIGNEPRFDTQDHRFGPVFYGKMTDSLSYDAGYLFGLSKSAPDGTVKFIVKYKW